MAVELAFGGRGGATDQKGALDLLGAQPFGKWLLLLMGIGLVGYSLWGFMRAILDPLQRGHDAQGLLERFGFLVSSVTYGILALVAIQGFSGAAGQTSAGNPQDMSAQLLGKPYGPWVVGLIGLFWLGAGLGQLYTAYTEHFKRDWLMQNMSAGEKRLGTTLGRIGYAARGVVFILIGWFVIQSALHVDPRQAQGIDGALLKLAQQPYGPILLGIVALGVVAFGVYSVLSSRWQRVWRGT